MSFFYHGGKAAKTSIKGISIATLQRGGCQICPLNHCPGNKNPQMPAHGSTKPIVYFLGEAPGETEDAKGRPFVGKAGSVLRFRVPNDWLRDIRMNNVVRTRPPKNRDPDPVEIECCRPSIVKDIEESKPEAIFGFGNVPLAWAGIKRPGDKTGIALWAGRRVPVQIGKHVCWYFPIVHPSHIAHSRRFEPRRQTEYGCDEEFAFALHIEKAFRQVEEGLPDPKQWLMTEDQILEGIEICYGAGGDDDVDRVVEFLKSCYDADASGLDYETHGIRPYEEGAALLSAAVAREGKAMGIGLDHPGCKWSAKQLTRIKSAFEDFLYDAPTPKVSFQLTFEHEWTAEYFGTRALRAQRWEDAQSQAYVIDERQGGLSLDFQMMQNFGLNFKAISNVDTTNLINTPIDEVLTYNGLDAKGHRSLFLAQRDRLEELDLMDVYEEQLRRAPTMVLSQRRGVPIDQDEANRFANVYEAKREEAERAIIADPDAQEFLRKHNLRTYNPGPSSQHVPKLFRWLGYDVENTDEAVLREIEHPLAQLTLDWRKSAKALSTYIYPCIKGLRVDGKLISNIYPDDLIHFIISITRTRTWRTASELPNIQNWPKRDEELREIRRLVCALISDETLRRYYEDHFGGVDLHIVSFDYAGIQARNIAMESLDETLIKYFWDRYDIHTDWMQRIGRIYPKWLDLDRLESDKDYRKHKRYKAKNGFVFPSFFGAQPKKTAGELLVPEWVTEEARREFFDEFPDVLTWQEELKKDYLHQGYVTGLSRFRRRAPIEQNQIINSPIQMDEAIIVCDAMARLSEMEDPALQAMLEIHDDLTFIWPKKDIERHAKTVITAMLDVPYDWAHVVPIEIEMSVGRNWADQTEIGAFASDTWKGQLSNDQRKKLSESTS